MICKFLKCDEDFLNYVTAGYHMTRTAWLTMSNEEKDDFLLPIIKETGYISPCHDPKIEGSETEDPIEENNKNVHRCRSYINQNISFKMQ